MAKGRSNISKACCRMNSFIRNMLLFPSSNASVKCYEWEYTMTDQGDILESLFLDDTGGNTVDVLLNEALSDSAFQIYSNIVAGFNAQSIPYEAINVEKTDLGGGLFTITITLYGITYTNLVGQAAGSATAFTETSCDVDYLQDSDNENILDSLGLPIITS